VELPLAEVYEGVDSSRKSKRRRTGLNLRENCGPDRLRPHWYSVRGSLQLRLSNSGSNGSFGVRAETCQGCGQGEEEDPEGAGVVRADNWHGL